MNPTPTLPPTAAAPTVVPPPARRFLRLRELLIGFGVIVLLNLAFRIFDEDDGRIHGFTQVLVYGLVAFFVGRAFWRWWNTQPPTIAAFGVWAGLVAAATGWLNVGLATWVTGGNQSNPLLIVIVPMMWVVGMAVSLAGLLAAGLGAASTATAVSHAIPGRAWIVAAGLAAVILNVAHILKLFSIFSGH